MTDEMLALARENQRKAGVENVEFLKGEIEAIPLPDNSVDVIISNCVINLSADKDRVLRGGLPGASSPGGRFAVSDVVVRGEVPAAVRRSIELWIGCVAGALEEGSTEPSSARRASRPSIVEPTRIYRAEDAREFLLHEGAGIDDGRRGRKVHECVRPGAQAAPGVSGDYIITVCDSANESCPIVPRTVRRLHWSFEDPSRATGTEDERLQVFRRIRDEISARVRAWVAGGAG